MNPGEAFCPRAAQKLGQHGLRLVVAGVRRGHRIHLARGHQLPEPAVAQPPRRFLNGLPLSPAPRRRHPRVPRGRASPARAASARANSRSASASAPRSPWCRWAACSTRPSSPLRPASARSRATESAPPETPTARRIPGRSSVTSIGSVGEWEQAHPKMISRPPWDGLQTLLGQSAACNACQAYRSSVVYSSRYASIRDSSRRWAGHPHGRPTAQTVPRPQRPARSSSILCAPSPRWSE